MPIYKWHRAATSARGSSAPGAQHALPLVAHPSRPARRNDNGRGEINEVIDSVAARLVNTRAVCRASYIHPRVFEDFETGRLVILKQMRPTTSVRLSQWMDDEEIRVLRWLKAIEKNGS